MGSRLELHEILCTKLGSRNVYFQPPEDMKINYPAIVYSRDNIDNKYANDNVYMRTRSYQITLIDRDPDSVILDKLLSMKLCKYVRSFRADNLNHDILTLNY